MAGLLPGDSSHHGMVENGSYRSQDKPGEAGRWYLSRKEIEESSPSRRDGIDLKKETYFRKSYCTFLQDLGMRLKVPQVTIATAIIFCHRFFLRQSHAKNDRRTIATVCMFLAGKVEETPRPLKDVILVSYEMINKKDPAATQKIKQKEVYEQQKEFILFGEKAVLATLGFDLNLLHPYKPLVEAIKKFKVAQNALAQVAWNFVNDGLRTSLCLQFKPHHIAAGAIFLAAKFLKVKLPSDGERVWWQEFDVTPRQLEDVSNQMLELYEQNRVPPSQGSEVEGSAGAGVHCPLTKALNTNEESGPENGHAAGEETSAKPGSATPPSTRPMSERASAPNSSGSQRSTQNRSDGNGSAGTRIMSEHKVDGETKDRQHSEPEPLPPNMENVGETSDRPMLGLGTPLSTWPMSEQSVADNPSGSRRSTQNRSNDNGSLETRNLMSEHKVDGETTDRQHSEKEPFPSNRENVGEASDRPMLGLDQHVNEDQETDNGRKETMELWEGKRDGATYKSGSTGGWNLDLREGPVSQSLQDPILKIDKDKVKAALERQRKSRGDSARKMDLMDEDDLIERELEDGIELAVEDERIKRVRRQSWSKLLNNQELETRESGRDNEDTRDGNYSKPMGQSSLGPEMKNVKERKATLIEDGEKGFQSPKSSSPKRKSASPDDHHSEGKQRSTCASGYHHNH